MNADEQNLIRGLFDRISAQGAIEKDAQADALIRDGVSRNADAPYLLVQSVLVQEHALQAADARIRELESRITDLEAKAKHAPSAVPAGAGSSVPAAGASRATSGFGAGRGTASATPSLAAANANGSQAGHRPQGGTGGGFMAQAMSTAAGVAGGMLLASGISSLFSGDSATAAETPAAADAGQQPAETEQASAADAGNEQATGGDDLQQADVAEDEGGGWGDFGDFGGDFDI